MNGVRSLISMWKWTEAEQVTYLRKRIKGIIFDSAPARTSAGPDSHAVVDSTPPIEGLEWVSKETRRKFIKYVEWFLEHERELGKDVEEVVFEGSEHVQHFRKFPEQYRSACLEFLRKIEDLKS
ncbi:hypothetical protein NECAME_05265 [Necator americanus]|uniref:Uncharacterized protein n=1 Tax=Necator americanus TaxID=51031 RepID=W2SIK3_NECAM|nr:hypothetical protein NECAME_05265 [Necator americanus]ETN69410.1 hypothetical protein NECAME_05265 [Necator americanus]